MSRRSQSRLSKSRIPMTPADIMIVLREDHGGHTFALGSAREIVHDRHGLGSSRILMWGRGRFASELREDLGGLPKPNRGEEHLLTFMNEWGRELIVVARKVRRHLRRKRGESPQRLLAAIRKRTEEGEEILREYFTDSEIDLAAPINEMMVDRVRRDFLKIPAVLEDPHAHLAGYLASEGTRHIVPLR